jgi:hypothetical protein
MRVLPEEVLVRRSVGQGIGRALRDAYANQLPTLLPEYMKVLLPRLGEGLRQRRGRAMIHRLNHPKIKIRKA